MVKNPKSRVVRDSYTLNWVVIWLFGAGKDLSNHGLFGGSEDIESNVASGVDAGIGHGHAPGVMLRNVVGSDEVIVDMQGCSMRKKRCGMAVVAHAEHDEIERMVFEDAADGGLVGDGILFDVLFGYHAVDLVFGDGY